jgi:hypothetical protein
VRGREEEGAFQAEGTACTKESWHIRAEKIKMAKAQENGQG